MGASLLVFDLDGTLVDTAPDLLGALDAVLPLHGFSVPNDPNMRDGIGHGARHLIEYSLHQQGVTVNSAKLDAMLDDFLAHYEAHICDASSPYPGILDVLDRFAEAGWHFAVCTNKLEGLSRRLLDGLGLSDRFAAICGGDTFASRKPHPAHLLQTILRASGARDRTVMVGDSRTDVDTARSAGVPVVGVTFGYTPVPMAELQPDILLDRFEDLRIEAVATLLQERETAGRTEKRVPLAAN